MNNNSRKKNKQISIKLTFLHGLGLISKLALNCLLCAAVNIVRGRFGPLVLSWLYTLCHFCINISAIVIINACIIMVVVVLVLMHLILETINYYYYKFSECHGLCRTTLLVLKKKYVQS